MDRPLFSEMLASRRRQLGYSIVQASRVLRLREDVLIAFEEGDFERMPKSGYAQGMLSSYARYLGLDATEVVDAYAEDYERYRREDRHRGARNSSGGSSQAGRVSSDGYVREGSTYVASKGLLPTSGGFAGDMGSFATTRVRSRGVDAASTEVAGAPQSYEPVPAYPQSRPYTGRTPSRTHRGGRTGSTRPGDIETLRLDQYDYEDDLRLGREARPYESASSRRGRRSSRNLSSTQRPRVNRSGARRGRGSSSTRRGSRKPPTLVELILGNSSQVVLLAIVGVIVLITVILVFSVSSCVRQDSEAARTVPVSSATSETEASAVDDSTEDGSKDSKGSKTGMATSETTSSNTTASKETTSGATQDKTSASAKETSVSVSVADGAVTWLEVECDGKSDVADTITGPWQRTYTVEDSLSVRAHDTTAVTVVKDGSQLQFDSMASGIGTLRVQGTKPKTKTDAKDGTKTDSTNGSGSTAKMGNSASSDAASSKESEEATTAQSEAADTDEEDYDDGEYGYDEYGYDQNSGYEE
jgi:hypothetical protein